MFRSLCNDSEEYNLKASIHVYDKVLKTFNLRKYYLVQSVQISWLHYFVYYMYFNNINIFMSKLHEIHVLIWIHVMNSDQYIKKYFTILFERNIWSLLLHLVKRHIQMFTWNLHCIKILENVEKVNKTL